MEELHAEGQSRRYQFGVRRLLVWTVVVAVWLGVLKMLGVGAAGLTVTFVVMLILEAVGAVRKAYGGWPALVLWIGLVMAFGVLGCFGQLALMASGDLPAGTEEIDPILRFLVVWLGFGWWIGLISYFFLEAFFRGLDWVDNLGSRDD